MLNLNRVSVFLGAAAVALASLFAPASAFADSRVTLNDGTVFEGDIVREGDQFLILRVTIGEVQKEEFLRKADISSIERDISNPAPTGTNAGEAPVTDDVEEEVALPPGATRIAFISLEEMVGPYFNTQALKRSVDALKALPEDRRPEILVLRINSGGGALFELRQIVPYIRDYVEPNFRTVAWIESAISAACMTSWVVDEVYMMSKGAMGACTAFVQTGSGNVAMSGAELEELLFWMEQVSMWGKKEPMVMRAMQIREPLSADIDENGTVTWRLDEGGEYLVSPRTEVLTLNSTDAVKFGVAQGIADTKNELATALGCTEWVEVGAEAEEMMVEFRDSVRRAEVKLIQIFQEIQISLQAMASSPDPNDARKHYGRAVRKFEQMKTWAYRKAPSLLTYGQFNEFFFEQFERQLDQIGEQLR